MIRKKLCSSIFLSALFFSFSPQISFASGCDSRSLQNLQTIKNYAERRGYSCRNQVGGTYLKTGGNYIIRTTLYSGNNYLLVGQGNENVRDLDIILADENGNEIDRDQRSDATPIVKVRPKWSGTYYVIGHMYRGRGCSNIMICSN